MLQSDSVFAGPVPEIYDRYMVPMLFQPYAEDMAARVVALQPGAVLETAAGSGVVTRVLAPQLAPGTRYVVSDLNKPMLDKAQARQGAGPGVEWVVADALKLDFDAASFDVVFCQFGAMFFPDRPAGYAEARRVLKPGGTFLFSVWDRLSANAVADTLWQAMRQRYAENPPDFFDRVPHGYFDQGQIRADLAVAGFADVTIEVQAMTSEAASARDAAVALTMGTPFRMMLQARDPEGMAAATDTAEAALQARFGSGRISAPMQALVVVARA
jgi:SAM-dependent methyltransferase